MTEKQKLHFAYVKEQMKDNPYAYIEFDKALDEGVQMIDNIAKGRLVPLVTSIRAERKVIRGYLPTDQIVLAGRSGSGKTSKAISDMKDFVNPKLNPTYADRLVILFDSWEISGWRSALKLIGNEVEMTASELLNWEERLRDEQVDRIKAVSETFKGLPIVVSEISSNPAKWEASKRQIAKKFPYPKYQVLNVVDHTRLITNNNNLNEQALLTNFMVAGIRVKKQLGHINVFLSQLNRNIENSANSRDDIGKQLPIASDLFGSDAVMQCADIVCTYHRPGAYNLLEFEFGDIMLPTGLTSYGSGDDRLLIQQILKNRNGEVKPLVMQHNIKYNRFMDIDNMEDFIETYKPKFEPPSETIF